MSKFAVIENNIVLTTIVAESKAIAEEITGATCVEYTTELAEPGGTYLDGKFTRRKPYDSWVSDGDGNWFPPVDAPSEDLENPKRYTWNEETISWVEVV
jgi:hypothetical protein